MSNTAFAASKYKRRKRDSGAGDEDVDINGFDDYKDYNAAKTDDGDGTTRRKSSRSRKKVYHHRIT